MAANYLKLDRRIDGSSALINADGEIDYYTSPQLDHEFTRWIEQGCTQFIVNMKNVRYIDSSGLSTLIEALSRIRPQGGAINLVGCNPNVAKIFSLTGLDHFLKIVDPEEALISGISSSVVV